MKSAFFLSGRDRRVSLESSGKKDMAYAYLARRIIESFCDERVQIQYGLMWHVLYSSRYGYSLLRGEGDPVLLWVAVSGRVISDFVEDSLRVLTGARVSWDMVSKSPSVKDGLQETYGSEFLNILYCLSHPTRGDVLACSAYDGVQWVDGYYGFDGYGELVRVSGFN